MQHQINWVAGGATGVWEDPANWSQGRLPIPSDDITINGMYSVVISSSDTIETLKLRGCANLTIVASNTLLVSDTGNQDGVDLDSCSALVVNGTLISSLHNSDGIDINEYSSLTVGSTGAIIVNNVGGDGIEVSDNITNAGTITITNHTNAGINAKGDLTSRTISNTGSITISGGTWGLNQTNDFTFDNMGTVTLSNASTALIDDGSNFVNKGTFKGDGYVENGDGNDVVFNSGSTLAPGTSTGTLTFEEELDIKGVTLEIEINGVSDYDKVIVAAGSATMGDVILVGAELSLSGSYVPTGGEVFLFLQKSSLGGMTGTFNGIPEGGMVEFNGALFTISYLGGDGNDMTMTFDSPLPVELINFGAKALEEEVKLFWSTASETNNDYFTIERSSDGRNFEAIAEIFGNGTTTTFSNYSFTDKNPERGLNYYRLKQTDFDGKFTYSDIKTVEFESIESVLIYPTMVNNLVNIEIELPHEKDLKVVLRDLTGRIIKQFSITENKSELSLSNLNPGSYFISIYGNDLIRTQKIIKF